MQIFHFEINYLLKQNLLHALSTRLYKELFLGFRNILNRFSFFFFLSRLDFKTKYILQQVKIF